MARKQTKGPSIGDELKGEKGWSYLSTVTVDAIVKAHDAEAGSAAATDAVIQRGVDEVKARVDASKVPMRAALKGNAKTNSIRAEVNRLMAEVFGADKGLGKSAVGNYATSFLLSLEYGRPFSRSLFLEGKAIREAAAAKNGTKSKTKSKTSGPVSRTSWGATLKTAERLLEQLGLMKASAARQKSAKALRDWIAAQDTVE